LVISRQIVTLLGGELLARSEYGKGSCFEFTIPIQVRSSVPSDYQTTMGSKLPGSESGIRKILPSETRLKPDTRVGVPTERFVPIPTPLKEGQVSILVVDDDEDNHRLI